ncbi:immunoglobulin-like domain-containing protein [Listeria sp. PSOL-1]|uniref:immunoglobulin-like domain-containing protein n=1 Tax=Listeria sp. PSOL-1 TaxID=1844999 RepID=UPI0013D4443B|nr:immunoglobulin-like domain-containing protein [Listeria sp. PSOL-1]
MKRILTFLVASMMALLTISNAVAPLTVKAADGVTLEVGTEAELRAALSNNLVSKVVLKNDLALNEYFDYIVGHNVTIDGGDHTVALNNSAFKSTSTGGNNVTFANIKFTAGNLRTIFITDLVNYTVTFENVTLNGGQAVSNINGTTYVKGNNSFNTTTPKDLFVVKNLIFDKNSVTTMRNGNNLHAVQVYSGGTVQLDTSSKLSIDSDGEGIYLNGARQNLIVGTDAELNILSTDLSIEGTSANVKFGTGSKVKIDYRKAATGMIPRIYVNQLNLSNCASVQITSSPSSPYAIRISTAGQLSIDNVKYFDFRNENSTGRAIYMDGDGAVFSTTAQNIGAWVRGSNLDGDPQYTWNKVDTLTDFSGYTSIVGTTNVPEFQTQFKAENFERLSNGSMTDNKPVINASDKTLKAGDTFNPLQGVTASDAEDGDLTSKIQVTANDVNTQTPGTYHVTYKVTDSDGNITEKTITVTVNNNSKPVINASDKTLKAGDTFNPLQGVTASDAEDGDLTSKIQVTANDVNTQTPGTYHVTYKVTDSDGNITEKTITVTVNNNSKPVINASDKTLKAGDTFNPLQGVTASDAEDGDLTSKIQVTANDVNTQTPGTYHVTYKVTDSDGNITEKTITVIVKNNSKPVINASDKALKTGDKFDPLQGVTASDAEDGDLTSKIQVTANDVNTQTPGTYHVTYKVTDSDGNVAEKTITVTVKALEGEVKVLAPFYIGKDNWVQFSTSGEITKVYLDVNGTKYQLVKVAGGENQYYAKDKITALDQNAKVVGTNDAGTIISSAPVVIKDGSLLTGTVAAKTYHVGTDSWVTGTYTGSVKTIVLQVGDKTYAKVAVAADGTFKYYAKDLILSVNDNVKVIGYNAEGTPIANGPVKLEGPVVLTGTVTPDDYVLKSTNVTGTYTGDVKAVALQVNGQIYSTVKVGADGKFQYYAKDKIVSLTDDVKVLAYNSTGDLVDTKPVKILASKPASGTITPDDYVLNDSYVTGIYKDDVKTVALQINGQTYSAVKVGADGKFQYYAKGKILSVDDDVKVLAYNVSGELVDTKPVKILTSKPALGTVTPDDYVLNDAYIAGTYAGNVKTVALEVNGQLYETVNVGPDGKFQYYAKGKVLSADDTVKVLAYNASGELVDTKPVKVLASKPAPGTITPNNYILNDSYVTGSYTGAVKQVALEINGQMYDKVNVGADGKFQYYAKGKILSVDDVVKVYAYNADGILVDTKPVTVTGAKPASGTVTPENYILNDSYVTGSYTGAVKTVALEINGQVYDAVNVGTDGKFQYYAKGKILSVDDVVKVLAYNASGELVDTKSVKILASKPATGTVTPENYILNDSYVTGSYTGAVKTVALEINGQVYDKVNVGTDGKFQYYAKGKILSVDDVVKVLAYNADGVLIDTKPVTIIGTKPASGTVTPENYTLNDSYVTGSYTGAVKTVALEINGQVYDKVNVGADGKFQYYAKGKIASATDTVKVLAYNADGVLIDTKPVTIMTATPAPGTVTPENYTLNDSYVTGTYTGAVKTVALQVNGQVYDKVNIGTDGKFQYYAKGKIASTTDVVKVLAYNADGVLIDTKPVTVTASDPASGKVTPDNYILNDSYVTGTYTGTVKTIGLEINGQVYGKVNVGADGKFQYYAKGKITSTSDVVKVYAYDADGVLVDTKPVTVTDSKPVPGTINTNNYVLNDSYVTGIYTGAVKTIALQVNDKVYDKVNVGADGKFQYYAKGKIISTTDTVKVLAYNADGILVDTKPVTVTTATPAPGTITPDDYILNDSYVTGIYAGNVKTVTLKINDQVYDKVNVGADGKFQYYAKGKITSATDIVSVLAYNSDGVLVDTKSVKVLGSNPALGTITTDEYAVDDSFVTGTYTGNVKTIALKINDQVYDTVNVGTDGKFQYYAKGKITSATDVVSVLAYNSEGALVDTKSVTVKPKSVPTVTITPDAYTLNTNNVTGTYTGGIARIALQVGSTVYGMVPVAADGTFKYYAKNIITSATDVVQVIAYANDNTELGRKTVTIN